MKKAVGGLILCILIGAVSGLMYAFPGAVLLLGLWALYRDLKGPKQ